MSRSLFLKSSESSENAITRLINAMKAKVEDREFVRQDMAQAVLSFESADNRAASDLVNFAASRVSDMKAMYQEVGVDTKSYTDAQWKSGAIIQAALGSPTEYHRAAMRVSMPKGGPDVTVFEHSVGSVGFDGRREAKLNLEAFDARELQAGLSFSTIYNINAARQDEFGEAFYQTFTVTPDMAGFEIVVNRTMVLNEVRHQVTGAPGQFTRVNLINAVVDSSILAQNPTQLVPVYLSGNSANTANFATGISAYSTTAAGVTFNTAPLKIGQTVDILGLSQNATLLATGTLDQTDSIDQMVSLDAIYLKVVSNDTTPATSYIKVPTKYLPRTIWQKSPEGLDREVILSFANVDIPLASAAKDITGASASALATFLAADPTTYVRLKVQLSGDGNLETGDFTVNATPVSIASVWTVNSDGSQTQVTDPTALSTITTLVGTVTVVGYDLGAYLSDINRRLRGINVETVWQAERRMIPLGPPITALNPVTATRTATDLSAPITATRIRNSNLAVTKLLAYRDMLATAYVNPDYSAARPQIEGIGSLLVAPFYKERTVNCLELVNSIKSSDRAHDLASALVNLVRQDVYHGYTQSGYQPALDAHTGNTGETPVVLIGTDPEIQRHLMVDGDTRLASIGFAAQVVTSYDSRLRGKMAVTLVRKNLSGPDPLSFGCMAWMPELATNVQVTRNGEVVTETMVQPRVLHVNTLPFLIFYTLNNVGAAAADKLAIPFKTSSTTDDTQTSLG